MVIKNHLPFQVQAEVKAIPTSHVHVSLDDNKMSIAITGAREEVKQVAAKVHEITKKYENEKIRRRTSIKEPMKAVKKWQIELFGLKGLDKKLTELFEGVSIILNPAEKTILLEAPINEIIKIKIKIFEEISKFQTMSKEVSPLLADFIGSKAVMTVLQQEIARFVQVVVEVQNIQIQIHAATKDDAVKTLAVLDKTVCEENIAVDTDAVEGLQSESFQSFCSIHERQNNGKVKIKFAADKQVIHLCCTSDKKEELSHAVKDFLNAFHRTKVEMDYGEFDQTEELQQLRRKHPDGQVYTVHSHDSKIYCVCRCYVQDHFTYVLKNT